MEVHGITPERDYRISFRHGGRVIRGLVPEAVVARDLGLPPRPPHGAVYEWIANNRTRIEKTLVSLSEGKAARKAPFDALALAEED